MTSAFVEQLKTPYTGASQGDFLGRLLQPGHQFGWTSPPTLGIGSNLCVTEALASALGSLPLTRLRASLACLDVRFFTQLLQLTDLELNQHLPEMDLFAFVQSLRHCAGLTSLSLSHFELSSLHIEALLPALPRLSRLSLVEMSQLESLRCFDSPPLAASLTSLSMMLLRGCPPTELTHLFGLVSLRSLSHRTARSTDARAQG